MDMYMYNDHISIFLPTDIAANWISWILLELLLLFRVFKI